MRTDAVVDFLERVDALFLEWVDALCDAAARKRDRIQRKLAGRSAYVAATGALVAGFSLAGTSAATTPEATPAGAATAEAAQTEPMPDRGAPGGATGEVPEPAGRPDWMSPMPDARVTSCYGPRWGMMHAGVDLAQPENAPIFAAGAGRVTATGWLYTGYGISVVIDHGDGHLTHYAHLNKTNVAPGDPVVAGDLIGWEGSTGDSTGPHLHFEVHRGMWNQIDPAPWLAERGVDLTC